MQSNKTQTWIVINITAWGRHVIFQLVYTITWLSWAISTPTPCLSTFRCLILIFLQANVWFIISSAISTVSTLSSLISFFCTDSSLGPAIKVTNNISSGSLFWYCLTSTLLRVKMSQCFRHYSVRTLEIETVPRENSMIWAAHVSQINSKQHRWVATRRIYHHRLGPVSI